MTLNELIENLTNLRDSEGAGDSEVVMTADYGDISHTVQALPINGAELRDTCDSAYSSSGLALVDPNDLEGPDTRTDEWMTRQPVVALSQYRTF